MRKVVVTGIGAVTPLGNTFIESWEAVKKGQSGISEIKNLEMSDLPWKMCGELKGFNPGYWLDIKEIRRLDPFVHYAVAAAVMAVEDANLIKTVGKRHSTEQQESASHRQKYRKTTDNLTYERSHSLDSGGVIIGSSRGGISTIEKALNAEKATKITQHLRSDTRRKRLSPYLMPATTISMASSYVAQKIGAKGYCLGISNACSSGANAIGEAYRLIKSGFEGPVIAGGSDAPLCRLCIEGYGYSGVLSKKADSAASRPFDIERDGFVISEGACILVLEELNVALNRGANIYGEIIGYSCTADAFHQTKPDIQGEARALETAMKNAGIEVDEVQYISTHGTSTQLGDRVEAQALYKVFGNRHSDIPVSAIKSMTGHMIAASGAFEAACTIMTIKEGVIPPTINLVTKDPDCNINIITEKTEANIKTAISSSFGFGGVNAVLIFRRYNSLS